MSREFRNASKTKFTTDNSNKIFAAMQQRSLSDMESYSRMSRGSESERSKKLTKTNMVRMFD